MSGWGIADTAPKIEKIKAESADYLHGLDSCGKIEWSTYSDMFDFYADLIEKAYAQGKEDAQHEIIHCNSCKHWTQSTGKMKVYGLGRCDFHDADLVTCNGFCYWAERRNNG